MSIHTYDVVQPPRFEQLTEEIEQARKLGQVCVALTVVERMVSELDYRRGTTPTAEELYFTPQLRSYGDDSMVGRVQTDVQDADSDVGAARVSRHARYDDAEWQRDHELVLTVFRT